MNARKALVHIPFEHPSPIYVTVQDPAAHELRRIAREMQKEHDATVEADRAVRSSA